MNKVHALLVVMWALGMVVPVTAQDTDSGQVKGPILWTTSNGDHGSIESRELKRISLDYQSLQSSKKHEILDTKSVAFDMSQYCNTADLKLERTTLRSKSKHTTARPQIGIHFEVDYQSYLDHNSDVNQTLAWVNSIFEQVQSIYKVHNINLEISQIKIWDSQDPYISAMSPYSILQAVGQELQNNYSGNVVQYLTTRSIGGGRAHLNSICENYDTVTHFGPYAVATSISPDIFTDSVYNWNAFVVAHELGHVFGSPHSHACFWGPNGDQSLDNCFASEGGCEAIETPSSGTVMSYCYNKSIGVDFANGLGQEPGAYVHDLLLEKTCVSSVCELVVYLNDMIEDSIHYAAQDRIQSTAQFMHLANASLSAGQEIQFLPGTFVEVASQLSVYNEGCPVNKE